MGGGGKRGQAALSAYLGRTLNSGWMDLPGTRTNFGVVVKTSGFCGIEHYIFTLLQGVLDARSGDAYLDQSQKWPELRGQDHASAAFETGSVAEARARHEDFVV